MDFKELGLSPWIVRQCAAIGIRTPTPVQANCIPEILKGRDCIGAAKTGTGKTLAFALPILEKLNEDPYGIYAVILTATRELAAQITDQFRIIGKPMNLRTCLIIGGMDWVEQGIQLSSKPHIVIATPGRLVDHLESCDTFSLSKARFLVLDEADRLLGGRFDQQVKTIFDALPKERQNLFFSATITDTLNTLKNIYNKDVFLYEAPAEVATVDTLLQQYVPCSIDAKDAYLVEVIRLFRAENRTGNVIIFTDTCKNCQALSMMLNEVGFENVALHGLMKQKQRLASLHRFKSNIVKALIATDVASRGLDIPTAQLVINHKLPKVPKEYIHRVGRTARAGRGGRAISLITPYDIKLIQAIEKLINTQLSELKINDEKIEEILTEVCVTKSKAMIELGNDFYERKEVNKRKKLILEGFDEEDIKKMKKIKKKRKKEIAKRIAERRKEIARQKKEIAEQKKEVAEQEKEVARSQTPQST